MKKKGKMIIAAGILAVLVFLAVYGAAALQINKVKAPESEKATEKTVGEEIPVGDNDVLVAESEGKKLYVNPASLNLIVEDTASGMRYEALLPDGKDKEASLINLTYVGEDNKFLTWDSFTYCLENETYSVNKLENGVRITMNFNEGASARFYEYLPEKMSVETYENVFKGGIDRLEEEGKIDATLAMKYKNTLKLIYKKSKTEESYNVNFVNEPPKSAVTQLIELSKLVGYTTEMLLEEAEKFNFTVTFVEPAVFDVVLDAVLEDGELVVSMPVDKMVSQNPYYTIQNIEILPNLCTTFNADVQEGYLLVPDGAGALMEMNTFNSKVPDYVRGFYNNDYYTDYYYRPEYAEELMMPVFGMLYEQGTKPAHGFFGIVEEGADTAYAEAMLASAGDDGAGRQYNKVYTSFDVSQYEWVRVFGEYAENTSEYLVLAPQTEEDVTVRYLFYGEDVSYYKMAKDYQSYLCRTNGTELPGVYADKAELFFEVIGALSIEERILGVPYDTKYSMTTYEQLADIVTELSDMTLNVSYLGAFDGGMRHGLMKDGKLVSANGSKKELESLLATAKEQDATLFMETDFMKVYDTFGNGFLKGTHALRDYSKEPAVIYGYGVSEGIFYFNTNNYYLLAPEYLVDTVQDFAKSVEGSYNYYLNNLTEHYYAAYGTKYVAPKDAQALINQAIESMPEGAALALDNPRADKLKYGTIAVDIARASSEYSTFYTSIPFRQLVLNGMMEYTTTPVNNNSKNPHYFVMQAIELGSQPKFILSSSSVDVLKDTKYSHYFSIQYDLLKEDIRAVYDEYAKAMDTIGTAQIVNHTMLDQDIFLTEYANGTKVVTNYTSLDFEYDGKTVAPNDYLIVEGR